MANSTEAERLMRIMSIIPEEDSDIQVLDKNKDSFKEEDALNAVNEEGKIKPPLQKVDATHTESSGLESGNNGNLPTCDSSTETVIEDDSRKNKNNFDDSDVLDDLFISEDIPQDSDSPVLHISTSGVVNGKDTKDVVKDTAFVAEFPDNSLSNNSNQNNTSTAPMLIENPQSFPTKVKDEQPPTTDVEAMGHRYFEVSNVDESLLRSQTENDKSDKELTNADSDPEFRPLLEKLSSSNSDSESTFNFDTIGPLENPKFLKMLNYSVSRTVQDDGFRGTSNLDLTKFTGTQPTVNMDAGWAWVVLFAAFCSLSLVGATTFVAGVLMSAILQIDPDITKASWIGAVHISVLCMSGPFVGIVLNRLGARFTAFCAGLVLSGGLFGAAFSSTVIQLILTHGLVAGIGSGFILNVMFVTVGQYFNRYRGLACGLLATGSGVGMLAGGNALTVFFNMFGLSGTYMMWSGVTLHSLVFAMLLRPSPAELLRAAEKAKAKNRRKFSRRRDMQGDSGSITSGSHSVLSGRTNSFRRSQRSVRNASKQDVDVAPLLKSVLHRDVSASTLSVNASQSQLTSLTNSEVTLSKIPSTPVPNSSLPSSLTPIQDQTDESSLNEKLTTENTSLLESASIKETSEGKTAGRSTSNTPPSPTYSRTPSDVNHSFRRRLISGSSQTPSQFTSAGRMSYRPSIREQLQRGDVDNESLASTLVSHLQPLDALNPRYRLGSRSVSSMFGSFASLPTALVIIKDDLSRVDATDGPKKKEESGDCITNLLVSLRLLSNKPFLVFISTCMLWALADSPFSLYLPAYAMSKGSNQIQASSLYTGMGFGSMCGRFLSGLVASDSGIGPVLLHIGCLGIAGCVVGLSPWITSTYVEQMVCAGLFGLYTGSLVPLSSLITIELLGIEDLGIGFGFLSLAQGIGYLAGPPLLGIVIQSIGYEMSFMIQGFIFLCASSLAMMIAVLIRNVNEEDLSDSFDDLEKALRKISVDSGGGNDESLSNQGDAQDSKTANVQLATVRNNKQKSTFSPSSKAVIRGPKKPSTR